MTQVKRTQVGRLHDFAEPRFRLPMDFSQGLGNADVDDSGGFIRTGLSFHLVTRFAPVAAGWVSLTPYFRAFIMRKRLADASIFEAF